ncbi:EamA family transporter [Candidatus Parcubacteria bacterium]|nr:EamA family transporter [Candidatus Parcubacteria bacterium]
MNALFPILAAVLQAGSFTLDKVVLGVRHVSHRTYVVVSFPFIFLTALAIYFVVQPPLSWALLGGRLGWLLFASVVLTVLSNFIFYRALEDDRLTEIETIGLLDRIPVILAAGVLFVDERQFALMVPALVAAATVAWSHWEGRLRLASNTWPLLFWTLLAAPIGAAVSKQLLTVWNPISLELVRSAVVAAIFVPLYRRSAAQLPGKAIWLLVATNILTSIAWIFYYFSYQRSGIVYTVLLFSLQPLLVYAAALLVLKERFQPKKFVAFLVVLASIAAAQFMR